MISRSPPDMTCRETDRPLGRVEWVRAERKSRRYRPWSNRASSAFAPLPTRRSSMGHALWVIRRQAGHDRAQEVVVLTGEPADRRVMCGARSWGSAGRDCACSSMGARRGHAWCSVGAWRGAARWWGAFAMGDDPADHLDVAAELMRAEEMLLDAVLRLGADSLRALASAISSPERPSWIWSRIPPPPLVLRCG